MIVANDIEFNQLQNWAQVIIWLEWISVRRSWYAFQSWNSVQQLQWLLRCLPALSRSGSIGTVGHSPASTSFWWEYCLAQEMGGRPLVPLTLHRGRLHHHYCKCIFFIPMITNWSLASKKKAIILRIDGTSTSSILISCTFYCHSSHQINFILLYATGITNFIDQQ